jgi:ethanolamine ammonia-lyase large subunit
VVGFIGPEYLYDGKQIIRAGLEDHFCGKLLGLPWAATSATPTMPRPTSDDMDNLLTLLGAPASTSSWAYPGPTTSC